MAKRLVEKTGWFRPDDEPIAKNRWKKGAYSRVMTRRLYSDVPVYAWHRWKAKAKCFAVKPTDYRPETDFVRKTYKVFEDDGAER